VSDFDRHNGDDDQESEFGLGAGLIDPVSRANRVVSNEQQMQEIYALPKTFDRSMPNRQPQSVTPVPRLLPGESESDRG
jgi:hypothetical protein